MEVILLNGGMTRVPTIRERLRKFFGVDPVTAGDPDMAVVRGAVAYHYNLHRGVRIGAIQNDTIGIEVKGGFVRPIVPAGTALPYRSPVIRDFVVSEDGTFFVDLPFYLGRRTDTAAPNRKIASRRVRFQKPLRAGDGLCLEVAVDERSIMSLRGWPVKAREEVFEVTVLSDGSKPEDPEPVKSPGDVPTGFRHGWQHRGVGRTDGERLMVEETMNRFKALCKEGHEASCDSFREGQAMARIRKQEQAILSAGNGLEFVKSVLHQLGDRTLPGLYKSRLVFLAGELGVRYAETRQEIMEQVLLMIQPERFGNMPQPVLNTTIRYAVEALGKVGDDTAERCLLSVLSSIEGTSLWSSALHSIGKIGGSQLAFEKVLRFIRNGRTGVRMAAFWSLAVMGSRERGAVPEGSAERAIEVISSRTVLEVHPDVLRNAVFALGELADRRAGRQAVSRESSLQADRAIRKIKSRVKPQTAGTLVSFCEIASAMAQGKGLSPDQETRLLGLRSLLAG